MTRSRKLGRELAALQSVPDGYLSSPEALQEAVDAMKAQERRERMRKEAADAWAGREPDPNPNWTI